MNPDCSELSQVLFELAAHHASFPGVNTIDKVLESMQGDLPDITRTRLVDSILEAVTTPDRIKQQIEAALSEAEKQLRAVKGEAKNQKQIEKRIWQLRKALQGRELTPPAKPKIAPTEAIAELRKIRDELYKDYQASDQSKAKRRKGMEPSVERRLRDQIMAMDSALETGKEVPKKAASPIDSPVINMLRGYRKDLAERLKASTPERMRALQKQVAELERKIAETVDVEPKLGKHGPEPEALQQLIDRKTELHSELSQRRQDARDKKKLTAQVEQLRDFLNRGTLPPKKPPRTIKTTDDAVLHLRELRDALRKELGQSEAAQEQRIDTQLAELTNRLVEASYAPPAPKSVPASESLQRKMYERDRLHTQIRRKIESQKPATKTEQLLSVGDFMRAVKTAYDLSAPFRQGAWMYLSHPVRGTKNLKRMVSAAMSDQASWQYQRELDNHPLMPRAAQAKLYIARLDSELGEREELFGSHWAEKIPGVKGSERAYVTFLNAMRMDAFEAMVNTGFNIESDPATDAAIAEYVNIATGRGTLSSDWESAASAMNSLFFAPRFAVSRFQLLMQPVKIAKRAALRQDAELNKLIATEYARSLGGLAAVYGLAMMAGEAFDDEEWTVEYDPRSSDFGKIRIGNTRLDPLAGISQSAVLLTRIASGQRKETHNGEITQLRGEGVPYGKSVKNTLAQFLEYKVAPMTSVSLAILNGKHVMGEPVTWWSLTESAVVPLSMGDIYESLQENGMSRTTAYGMLALMGVGMQVHRERETKRTANRRRRTRTRRTRKNPR